MSTESLIKKLADQMDRDAASDNSHDFVGVHRALATIAYHELGPQATLKLLIAIKRELGIKNTWDEKRLGLHATRYLKTDDDDRVIKMKGHAIPRCWHDWSLEF